MVPGAEGGAAQGAYVWAWARVGGTPEGEQGDDPEGEASGAGIG